MRETTDLTGMVIKAAQVGDYNRRLVILTRERGKITAFARGAARTGSQLMAVSRPFVFGEFRLYEGKEAYNLQSAEIRNYFAEVYGDMEAACYGSYFLELADYFGREGMDATETLNLLYVSLRALLKPAIPNRLIQSIFELRIMMINGEYTEHPDRLVSDSANYAWEYILASPLEKLYSFVLKPEAQKELQECVDAARRRFIDRQFHSLEILQMMTDPA